MLSYPPVGSSGTPALMSGNHNNPQMFQNALQNLYQTSTCISFMYKYYTGYTISLSIEQVDTSCFKLRKICHVFSVALLFLTKFFSYRCRIDHAWYKQNVTCIGILLTLHLTSNHSLVKVDIPFYMSVWCLN